MQKHPELHSKTSWLNVWIEHVAIFVASMLWMEHRGMCAAGQTKHENMEFPIFVPRPLEMKFIYIHVYFYQQILKLWYTQSWGHEVTQWDIRRLFAPNEWVRIQNILCGICVEKGGPGADFSQGSSVFTLSATLHQRFILVYSPVTHVTYTQP